MLGKLLKYEFRATGRMMLPFLGALAVLSVAARLCLSLTSWAGVASVLMAIVLTLYFHFPSGHRRGDAGAAGVPLL